MRLLWISLLIVFGYVANAMKPGYPAECNPGCQCGVFNVPLVVCASDLSEVFLTPCCEYKSVPQCNNLLSKGSPAPLCDFGGYGQRCGINCMPKPCYPVGYGERSPGSVVQNVPDSYNGATGTTDYQYPGATNTYGPTQGAPGGPTQGTSGPTQGAPGSAGSGPVTSVGASTGANNSYPVAVNKSPKSPPQTNIQTINNYGPAMNQTQTAANFAQAS